MRPGYHEDILRGGKRPYPHDLKTQVQVAANMRGKWNGPLLGGEDSVYWQKAMNPRWKLPLVSWTAGGLGNRRRGDTGLAVIGAGVRFGQPYAEFANGYWHIMGPIARAKAARDLGL